MKPRMQELMARYPPKQTAATPRISARTREILGSLGYTAGGKQTARKELADPKDKLAEAEAYENGLTFLYSGQYGQAIRVFWTGSRCRILAICRHRPRSARPICDRATRRAPWLCGSRRSRRIRLSAGCRFDRRILAGAAGFREGVPVYSVRAGVRWKALTVNTSQAESGAEAPRRLKSAPQFERAISSPYWLAFTSRVRFARRSARTAISRRGCFRANWKPRYLDALRSEIAAHEWAWTAGDGVPGRRHAQRDGPGRARGIARRVPGRPWREATIEAAPGRITRGKRTRMARGGNQSRQPGRAVVRQKRRSRAPDASTRGDRGRGCRAACGSAASTTSIST